MTAKYRDTIAVRFSQYIINKIDKLVEDGTFKNRSDLVRTATTQLVVMMEDEHSKEQVLNISR